MKLAIGNKGEYGVYNANTLFDENDDAIAMVYGISINKTLEDLGDSSAAGLRNAQEIVDAVNSVEALRAQLAEAVEALKFYVDRERWEIVRMRWVIRILGNPWLRAAAIVAKHQG